MASESEKFISWINRVLLAKHDATGGMPLCPYAGKALRQRKVRIEEFFYCAQDLPPIVEKITWLRLHPTFDVLILVHPDCPYPPDVHRRLEDDLRPLAARLDQHVFSYHPQDPTRIGGRSFAMPVCALQFQPRAMVEATRRKLLKGRYYDRFTVEELKDLRFFG